MIIPHSSLKNRVGNRSCPCQPFGSFYKAHVANPPLRGGIFTLDKIIEKINDSNTELKKGILLYIDEVIHKINSGVTLNESEVEFVKVAFCVHRKKDIKNVTLSPDGKLIKKKKRKNKKYTNRLYSGVEQETHTEANLAHVQ